MSALHILDLQFQNLDHAIGAFLIESTAGPILIETGPHSTFPVLSASIYKLGYQIADIQHVFLTHIHLDHAGAAWAFANEGAKIYVHPFGARNMADPTKLYNSAKQIYQDQMDSLWGQMFPIAVSQLVEVSDQQQFNIGDVVLTGHHTPGHARHHIVWQLEDVLFTGDVAGVKIYDGPVVPPCPPPDISIEDWKASIALLRKLNPRLLYLTHYGSITAVSAHLDALEMMLDDWAHWVKSKMDLGMSNETMVPLFLDYTADQLLAAGVSLEQTAQYEAANPAWMSVAGLTRYWTKMAQS